MRTPEIFSRRNVVVVIALAALILPAMFLLRRSRAQTRKDPVVPYQAANVNRLLKPQTSSFEPISAPAVGFGVTRPVSEIARNQTRNVMSESDREGEDHEAAENRAIKKVSQSAQH